MAGVPGQQRILIVATGSRGDVQPYIGLAVGLRNAGFWVRLATATNFVSPIEDLGLEAVDIIHGDLEEQVRSNSALLDAMATGNVLKWLEANSQSNAKFFPKSFKSFLDEVESYKPDLLIHGVLECWHLPAVAVSLNVPVLYAGLTCLQPSQHIPTVCGEPLWLWGRFRLALAMLCSYAFVKGNADVMTSTIEQLLPDACQYLPRLDGFMYYIFHSNLPSMFGVSPTLRPRPPDWPEAYRPAMCGAWVVPRDLQVERMKDGATAWGGEDGAALEEFMSAGKTPVYVGWGSMVAVSPEHMVCLAIRFIPLAPGTLMALRERGVVLSGFAQLEPGMLDKQSDSDELHAYAAKNVLFMKTAPHEMLFPRCSVLVHHGGSGTTMAALRSGIPSVVTPVFLDQFLNADTVVCQGAGIKSQQFNQVTATALAELIRKCLEDQGIRSTAACLGEKLRSEDGVGAAVDTVRSVLGEVATGKYQELVTSYKKKIRYINSQKPASCFTWLYNIFCDAQPHRWYNVELPATA